MSERDHLRRDDPARTGPVRHWSNLYRRSDSWDLRDGGAEPREGTGSASWSGVVAQGVDLGYRVIEEQIAQGRRVAEQLGSRSYDASAMGDDFRQINERMWRYYADLGALWMEYAGSLLGGLAPWRMEPPRSTPTNARTALAIDVTCSRPTRVALDLPAGRAQSALRCHPLRALDEGTPPLSDVVIERDAAERLALRVRVPEPQPPGVYVGAIVDRETGEPRGTLSVRVER
jgi:hypothetical protein